MALYEYELKLREEMQAERGKLVCQKTRGHKNLSFDKSKIPLALQNGEAVWDNIEKLEAMHHEHTEVL